MSITRDLWHPACDQSFRNWPCPSCKTGNLVIIKDSISAVETKESKSDRGHEAWEPDWIDEKFSAFLNCQNCGDIVVVSGRRYAATYEDYDRQTGIPESFQSEEYLIKCIYPCPPLFEIHKSFPEIVVKELKCAFSSYWADHAACANGMRRTVEAVMSEQGMKTAKKNGQPIFLNSQIKEYEKTNSDNAELLDALKWLGNYGSHISETPHSKSDLLDGFELLEHVLLKIYAKQDEHFKNLALKLKTTKGAPK